MFFILDRDGVINADSDAFIKTPDEWLPIPGSLEAIARLSKAGHQVVVATNQSGIGRQLFSLETLSEIHHKMLSEIEAEGGHLDGIYFCPHLPDEGCECRKPKPGLLKEIARDFTVDFSKALLVGDALRDIEAAKAVDCPAALVLTGKGKKTAQANPNLNIPVYQDLADCVDQVC